MVTVIEAMLVLALLHTFAFAIMKMRLEKLAERRCALTCHTGLLNSTEFSETKGKKSKGNFTTFGNLLVGSSSPKSCRVNK